jgi:hypothetical protein
MKDILDSVDKLPDELIKVIYDFLPRFILANLSKKNYIKYHLYISKRIINYDSFIRSCIRNENDMVFYYNVIENNKKWLNKKKYIYNNNIFANYGFFLMHFCIEQKADKCKNILCDFWEQHGLCQNRHKKIVSKHIRWRK